MPITRQQVEYIAHLSRLELSEEEMERFAHQLAGIIQYAGKLNELDTSNVAPLVHAAEGTNVFREDVVKPSLPRQDALANAPESSEGSFKVPRIVE